MYSLSGSGRASFTAAAANSVAGSEFFRAGLSPRPPNARDPRYATEHDPRFFHDQDYGGSGQGEVERAALAHLAIATVHAGHGGIEQDLGKQFFRLEDISFRRLSLGRTKKLDNGMVREPLRPATTTFASRATRAGVRSDGWTM